jgi:hypothetical protein
MPDGLTHSLLTCDAPPLYRFGMRIVIATVLLSSTAMAGADRKPPKDADAPPALIELRKNLYAAKPTDALADKPRFRALCDAEGYPLVGNLRDKGITLTVADFCGEVRKAERKP